MIEIPVTIGFDNTRTIGMMVVDETKLPKGMDYVFSLAVRLNTNSTINPEADCELVGIGLIENNNYLQYLQNRLNMKQDEI